MYEKTFCIRDLDLMRDISIFLSLSFFLLYMYVLYTHIHPRLSLQWKDTYTYESDRDNRHLIISSFTSVTADQSKKSITLTPFV